MHNIPSDVLAQIRNSLKKPEGTFVFDFFSEELFDPNYPGGILFEMTAGKHFYRVERDQNFQLNFFHSSPGTGTRVASVNFHEIKPGETTRIIFSWCPTEIQLVVGPTVNATGPAIAKGKISVIEYRVGEDGGVHIVGDKGVEVSGMYVYHGNQAVLRPTAIQVWHETLEALDILRTGQSTLGYIYELVLSNLTIAVLATGFETYAKERFVELIHEGIEPDSDALIDSLYGNEVRATESKSDLVLSAQSRGISLAEFLAQEGKINFLSYKKCKLAFNKAYGIKFGELELQDRVLGDLKKYLSFRHKIIHVSPLLGCLNLGRTPPEQPVLPSSELSQSALECFNEFVGKLHEATLTLRPGL